MTSQERLKELFDYHPDGHLIPKQPNHRRRRRETTANYRFMHVDGQDYLLHRLVWCWHFGEPPAYLDHIDGDRTNNRVENLRPCTLQQNRHNTRRNSKTGLMGVTVREAGKRGNATTKYEANIKHEYLGWFDSPEEAAAAYDAAALKLYGEFARLNFPKER